MNELMHYGAAPAPALDGVLKSLENSLRSVLAQAKQVLLSSGADDSGTADALDQSIQNLDLVRLQVMSSQATLQSWRDGLLAIATELEGLIKAMVDQGVAPGTMLGAIQSFKSSVDSALSRAGGAVSGSGLPFGMVLSVLGIAGLGWWAFSSMKKSEKSRSRRSFAGDAPEDEPEEALADWQDEDDYLQLSEHSKRGRRGRAGCRR